jgi:hypothetical protein
MAKACELNNISGATIPAHTGMYLLVTAIPSPTRVRLAMMGCQAAVIIALILVKPAGAIRSINNSPKGA